MTLRMCEVLLYQEHFADYNAITDILDKKKQVKQYALVLHDRDMTEDGKPKKPHYHLMIHFDKSRDTTAIEKWFSITPNFITKIKGRWKDALLYLVHKNAPDKVQYEPTEVVANFDYETELEALIKSEISRLSPAKLNEMCSAVMLGGMSLSQALKELERYSYTPSAQKRLDDAYKLRCRNLSPERNIDVILMYGKSETGKTTFAKMFCNAEGKDFYISSSHNDLLQDYKGEQVLILDDARDYSFEFLDWLKLLDNNTGTSIKSRFFNKVFCGDTIIITTSYNPLMWFVGIHEARWQFFRRIGQVLFFDNDTIIQCDGFKQERGDIVPNPTGMSFNNPVTAMFQKTETNLSSRICKAMVKVQEMTAPNFLEIKSIEEITQ